MFGERAKYGYADDRLYTPPPVYLQDYLAMHDAAGFARGVIVQSGVHGANNSVIVDAIAQSNGRLRGVALPSVGITDAELDAPDQLVFGTDWPHVMMEGEMPNTGTLVEQLAAWAPDAATRRKILLDNPVRLYRFPAVA